MSKMIETSIKVDKFLQELHIRNKLPQIIVPADKVDLFIEWWNRDIRFLPDVPHSFDEGYLILHNDYFNNLEKTEKYNKFLSKLIKELAQTFNTTYRNMENSYNEFKNISSLITLYFKFVGNHLDIFLYGTDKKLITTMELEIGDTGEPEEEIGLIDLDNAKSFEDCQNHFNKVSVTILISSLWYLATTKSSKYYYERDNSRPNNINEEKRVVKVKKYKTISTPIYDFNRVREVKVDKCIQRRKGWTYSHSFQVHGHYRHYKNGKVIFVKSFIKGKDKDFKSQIIMLEPDNKHNNM